MLNSVVNGIPWWKIFGPPFFQKNFSLLPFADKQLAHVATETQGAAADTLSVSKPMRGNVRFTFFY